MALLGRLLSSAAVTRAGVGLMRRGAMLRDRAKAAPRLAMAARRGAIISKVKTQTRGIIGASSGHLYSKHTAAGMKRRNLAAQSMKAKRAGLPAGQTHSSISASVVAANRARTRTIVRNVKGITHSIMPKSQLGKGSPAGRFSRYQTAQFMKTARRGPAQWGNMGATYNLKRKP